MNRLSLLAPLLLVTACSGTPGGDDGGPRPDDLEADHECGAMFQQSVLPEYHVTISEDEWAAMQDEFLNRVEREQMGLEVHPYHPVDFTMVIDGQEERPEATTLLRLKGSSSWLQTIQLDEHPKMQFVIAFNEADPAGRFHGVRKIELDMPRIDQTFLHQRVALSYMREVGLPAQCANNARLYINGEYYGLFANVERLDKEFIQRNFGKDVDDGDLWESGRTIKTNEDTFTWDRIDAFWHIPAMGDLEPLADVDAAMNEWASEVVIGDADGYYNGRANFYLYDHPSRGFIWIPNDLDAALDWDFLSPEATPIFPACLARWERDWHHYILAMNDATYTERYVDAIREMRGKYDVATVVGRIDQYAAQIAEAAAEDPRAPFDIVAHDLAVSRMRDYASVRATYVDDWLACRDGGGADEDGDGHDMCHDCNDLDATIHPGATEVCDLVDNDCNGNTDNIDGTTVCAE
jgi:spore coat protein CotH